MARPSRGVKEALPVTSAPSWDDDIIDTSDTRPCAEPRDTHIEEYADRAAVLGRILHILDVMQDV